jgi:hypothetical protein
MDFNEHHAKMTSSYGKSITRHQVLWPAIIAFVALFVVLSTEDAQKGVLFLTGAFVWSLLVPAWIKKRFLEHVSEQLTDEALAQAIGDYSLKITPEGLMEVKPSGEELVEWASILRLEKSKKHVYLYMSENTAIIIPQSTVSEESDFTSFYAELVETMKASR